MKKTTLLFAIIATINFSAKSQLDIPRCLSPNAIDYQESITPGFKEHVYHAFEIAKSHTSSNHEKSGSIYTIPVVFHVVYNNSAQNIHDSVLIDQIRVLNEDYNRLNADTVNMRADFNSVAGSPKIGFKLAEIDENGQPTNGITRTQTQTASFGSIAGLTGDFTDLEKVKSTANGGKNPWDQSRYLNIWVCNMSINFGGQEITALLGYATPPAGLPNWPAGSVPNLNDGVVLQYQTLGSNNPNQLDLGNGLESMLGRTASHEVGHYLGLRHIWGDGGCTEQDGIDDTPNADAESDFDCDDTKNTCVDNIGGVDLPDMIENFMDYSSESCQNSFTNGQGDLMIGVLENQRYDLVHGNAASVNELSAINFKLYPNPTSNEFTISHDNDIVNLELVNVYGQKVISDISTVSGTHISISHLPNGIYLMQIELSNGTTKSIRVIKQ